MSDLQQQVQAAADKLVESGAERGLQVAVYQDGVQIVDVVAGVADHETGRPVTPDTPFYNFSIGKGATAAVAHVLAERGLFGYDTPVAELWPEFARHGKERVTVRHVLSHTAGVPGVPLDTTPEDVCDWGKMVAALEDAELWWEPGTKMGYHAYTFGFIVGEIVRRVTGKPISQVLKEDVAGPLGVADELYFGMPEREHARLARLEDAPMDPSAWGEMPADLPMFKAAPMSLMPNAELGNRPDYLSADIPAGGKTSARAIARMYAALLGEVDGVRLITPERLREATAIVSSGVDEIFGMPSAWGLGFGIGRPGSSPEQTPTVFGIGGAGGSTAWADTATGTTFALTKNRLTHDFTTAELIGDLVTAAR
ncbi:beta-lactamase family protein [Nonomuraea sp. FMUSA5-5]|uniref:Beta-lactamase family protein n=1 Tax=Nonomuraea composti TaxID=2720023 RepID=A0ABX1BH54_9ACTN|nr:serine hydrolase domain-containing protein [Nonomuraea sp. FMUSA5-5]NJP94168.1 beta-lactamase family protein [Nonomuraea sp. FMUSA5-5]